MEKFGGFYSCLSTAAVQLTNAQAADEEEEYMFHMNCNTRLKAACFSVYFSDFKALGIMCNHWYTCHCACG